VPCITAIIPAYNAQRTLEPAIRSALEQTRPPDEVLVIDDGSRDRTASIARAAGETVVCISTANRGVAAARNAGLERARGDLVAFLDADDLWEPVKLERQLEAMSRAPRAEACSCALRRVDDNLNTLAVTTVTEHEDWGRALLLGGGVAYCPSALLVERAAVLSVGGFREELSQSADWDLLLRLSQRIRLRALNEPLVLYRQHSANMSHDVHLLERDVLNVLGHFFADPPPGYADLRRRSYARHLTILSGSYFHAGQPAEALRCALRALAMHPSALPAMAGFPIRALSRKVAGAPLPAKVG
jgi:glycosyltransferase involved in cell wall biosynthesis